MAERATPEQGQERLRNLEAWLDAQLELGDSISLKDIRWIRDAVEAAADRDRVLERELIEVRAYLKIAEGGVSALNDEKRARAEANKDFVLALHFYGEGHSDHGKRAREVLREREDALNEGAGDG